LRGASPLCHCEEPCARMLRAHASYRRRSNLVVNEEKTRLPRQPFASSFLSLALGWLAMTVSGIANTFPSGENRYIYSPP
jgi:hypothetical protein